MGIKRTFPTVDVEELNLRRHKHQAVKSPNAQRPCIATPNLRNLNGTVKKLVRNSYTAYSQ